MDKICQNCKKKFPSKIKINGQIKNLQRRKYCLNCSPYKKHNTKKIHLCNKILDEGQKQCLKCLKVKSLSEFYNRENKTSTRPYCKKCLIQDAIERQKEFKLLCLKYKGDKCVNCGYNKCLSALEFHHLNPEKKELSFNGSKRSFSRKKGLSKEVLKELDKCVVLCANCHREEHEKMNDKN